MMQSSTTAQPRAPRAPGDLPRVYWHRELPPLDADIIGEHVLEATSEPVQGSLAHRDELWDRCYHDLRKNTLERFKQEIRRLGGDYAHVLDESVDSRHDDATGTAWLHGRFTYVLYRRGGGCDADAKVIASGSR